MTLRYLHRIYFQPNIKRPTLWSLGVHNRTETKNRTEKNLTAIFFGFYSLWLQLQLAKHETERTSVNSVFNRNTVVKPEETERLVQHKILLVSIPYIKARQFHASSLTGHCRCAIFLRFHPRIQ
jgi:hypothetical protein